ncbi:MAG: hypothetical protein CMJ83_20285 [Planctomycetes bacterium]|nr:hypothetical protein [Planctomycetota bacterium]
MCATKVRETLAKMDGVHSVDVDFPNKTVKVEMKKGHRVPLRRKTVEKLLKGNGDFKVTSFGPRVETAPKKKS